MGGGASKCTCAKHVVDAVIDVGETIAETVHDVKTLIVPDEVVPDDVVKMATPEALWFTPAAGWPREPAGLTTEQLHQWQKELPTPLIPTAAELPRHFGKPTIGELRIEVLECEGLPQLMQLGRVDPYCCVIFEGAAARNHTVMNNRHPRWGAYSPRAFKFPIVCPYSTIYLSINDDDRGTDDGLGRVIISLTSLRSNTLYDAWFALQYGALKKHTSRRGFVHLRFSISFADDRIRLLAYLRPIPTFTVPFLDLEARSDSAFAYRGRFPPHKFNWVVFNSHLTEVKSDLATLRELTEDFFFYKFPVVSMIACALFQVMVSYPHYIAASLPIFAMAAIVRSYVGQTMREQHAILAKPSLVEKLKQLLLGRSESPLKADPVAREMLQAGELDSDGDSTDSDSDSDDGKNRKRKPATTARGSVKIPGLGKLTAFEQKQSTLEQEMERIRAEVAEEIDMERQGVTPRSRGDDGDPSPGFTLNPLKKILAPVQLQLAQIITYLRTVRRALTWTDTILTLQLCLALLALSVILALLGWLLHLIPWGLVIEWMWRLIGLGLFGPHMYFVGKSIEKKRAAEALEAEEFANASRQDQKLILSQKKARLLLQMREKLDEEIAREEQVRKQNSSSALTDDGYRILKMRPNPALGNLKFLCEPDLTRSMAIPIDATNQPVDWDSSNRLVNALGGAPSSSRDLI